MTGNDWLMKDSYSKLNERSRDNVANGDMVGLHTNSPRKRTNQNWKKWHKRPDSSGAHSEVVPELYTYTVTWLTISLLVSRVITFYFIHSLVYKTIFLD